MSRHHNIVIVCDHGRKGDGRIEHERCDLVAPIIWVDETQGWLLACRPTSLAYDLKCAATGGCGCTGNSPA